MRAQPRRMLTCAVSTALVTLAAGLLTAIPSAGADTADVSITIDSPTENATVGGIVTVAYTVTAPAGTPLGSASAIFAGRGQVTNLTGRDCSAGCAAEATFDTATAPLPYNSDRARWTDDGPQWLSAEVSVNGENKGTSVHVTLDNDRPIVTVSGMDAGGNFPLTAHDTITIAAHAEPRDSGQIAGLTYVAGMTETPMTPPASPGEPWTHTIDTSQFANGVSGGAVRARDDRGIQNIGARATYVVDHGPTISMPTVPDPIDDVDLDRLTLTYGYGPFTTMPETRLTRIETFLDGVLTHVRSTGELLFEFQNPGKFLAYTGVRVPQGEHTLTYVVTDNRGATGRLDMPVRVNQTLFAEWQQGAEAVALPNQDIPVAASISSTSATLRRWEIRVDGEAVLSSSDSCSGEGCPLSREATGSVRSAVPGRHRLELHVIPSRGHPTTFATGFTVLPSATARLAAHPVVTYGQYMTLRAQTRLTDGAPATGATLVLDRRVAGSTTWQRVRTATSDGFGRASFTLPANITANYRVRTASLPGAFGGTTGPAITVRSRASIVMVRKPSSARPGSILSVVAAVKPVFRRAYPVVVQRYVDGRWRSVRHAYPSATGRTVWTYAPRSTGRHILRIVRPASPGVLTTTTRAWVLRVTR